MDAAKGQYIHWLPDVLRLLAAGGLLMSDNVLQDGTIMESRYAVERRDRTIHEPDAGVSVYVETYEESGDRRSSRIGRRGGPQRTRKSRVRKGSVMRKTELLIPAGSLDVLKTAVIYGADAVYLGGEAFGLRAKAKNFTNEEIMRRDRLCP